MRRHPRFTAIRPSAFCLAAILIGALAPSTPALAAPATRPADKPTLAQFVRSEIKASFDAVAASGDWRDGQKRLRAAFDLVVAYAPARDMDLFRDAAFGLRLADALDFAPAGRRVELLKFLLAHDNFAHTLVFLIKPGRDKPGEVLQLVDRLREARGNQLETYANLAAAVCVVHDKPLMRHMNENAVTSPDPVAVFDYFVKNEARMSFGLKNVPAELLIWVVDTTEAPDEMNWALSKYANDPKVGARFFDIKYDFDHVRKGTPKQVTAQGYTLQNILKYGGVCVDQAYFASSVGKAIGVPTAVAVGQSGEAGHAWVGFLASDGVRGWWNFDVGRYEAYRGIRGMVLEPQTRDWVPDSMVSLSAELIGTKPADRQTAAALADAALWMIVYERRSAPLTPAAPENVAGNFTAPRKLTSDAMLELLTAAVQKCPAHAPAWAAMQELAKDGKLSYAQKRSTFDLIQKLCGNRYPDFVFAMVAPMIATVEKPAEQDALWAGAIDLFRTRADLSAAALMGRAAMWEKAGDIDKAGTYYLEVVTRYANSGPWVIEALTKTEAALVKSNRAARVLELYDQAWSQTKKPPEMLASVTSQSNWYRIGVIYARKLEAAGETKKAAILLKTLSGEAIASPPR